MATQSHLAHPHNKIENMRGGTLNKQTRVVITDANDLFTTTMKRSHGHCGHFGRGGGLISR